MLSEGQRIGDHYEVERFLGQGAFAEVYRVRHRFLGRQAMKVFKHIGSREATEELLGEAILLSRIGHPNIVRVFNADIVETGSGRYGFFTMEYVPGGNLADFWHSHGDRFTRIGEAVQILRQICEGLAVAHGERPPIVHRDLTPQNILVGYDRDELRVRISDFGLAKRTDLLTGLASARGTLAFKSPEALRYRKGDSTAGDVWAVGVIAYLMLTDTLPFHDVSSPVAFFGTPRNEPPPSPQLRNPEVDDELAGIVLGALEPNLRHRTPDAARMGERLRQWHNGNARQ
ncbi:serine/threonine-protein kinase [Glycomyces buryatensis]|nr:serine/threonine-protein kinase [Glycomyces buryatensis]